MNKKRDALSRWWWPGQWLYIVYGVWIDQVWYWHNVRPKLQVHKNNFFVQSMLGSTLVVLALCLIFAGVVEAIGLQIMWHLMFLGIVAGLSFGTVVGYFYDLAWGVTLGTALGIGGGSWSIVMNVTSGIVLTIGSGVLIGSLLGLALAVGKGVVTGSKFKKKNIEIPIIGITIVSCTMILTNLALDFALYVIMGRRLSYLGSQVRIFCFFVPFSLTLYLGIYLAAQWVIRQIPDEATRLRLANPDLTE